MDYYTDRVVQGIQKLYGHQVDAITAIRRGENVVVVTPTASGKTITYLLPLLESFLGDPSGTALLLFPLKALEQDQRGKILAWQQDLRHSLPLTVEIYDGDTPSSKRAKIKRNPPHFVVTNPDMLHPDEKLQTNRLLGEWLQHCLRWGESRASSPIGA